MIFYNIILIILLLFIQLNNSSSDFVVRGVNIGGWMVLEPWITPSLFYNSFGLKDSFPIDMYTFCDYYNPVESNLILQAHWTNWVQEEDIKKLASSGINLLRVPIGDWMYKPYGPYAKELNGVRCTDGAVEQVDRLFGLAHKYGLKVILDLHGIKGSQNGFDNSGQTTNLNISSDRFTHWDIRSANWIGQFNTQTKQYELVDPELISDSLKLLELIFSKYSDLTKYPSLYGFNVLNEPWEYIPEQVLKKFYQDSFDVFTRYFDSTVGFIIHDSFRPSLWDGYQIKGNLKLHPIYIDSHQYTAWNGPYDSFNHLVKSNEGWQVPPSFYPYLIGEFSLAIDNCEMWLNGFMDNLEGFPKFDCAYKPCPLLEKSDNKDLIANSVRGPWGTGISYPNPITMECPTSINFTTHFEYHINTNLSDKELEKKEIEWAKKIFESKTRAYEKETGGWIFWNFKIESENYQWDLMKYLEMTKTNLYFGNHNNLMKSTGTTNNSKNSKYSEYANIINVCATSFVLVLCLVIIWLRKKNNNKLKTPNTVYYHRDIFVGSINPSEKIPLRKNYSNQFYSV